MTDRIKQGMKVEISDVLHPYKLWVATVRTELGIVELEMFKEKSILYKTVKYNVKINSNSNYCIIKNSLFLFNVYFCML